MELTHPFAKDGAPAKIGLWVKRFVEDAMRYHAAWALGRFAAVALLCAVVLLAGCGQESQTTPSPAAKVLTPPKNLNAIFVVIDAAAARYLGCYGNSLDTSPNIDAFAREATRFRRAYSQSSWTLPSVASFLTGKYPPDPGFSKATSQGRLKALMARPMALLLKEAGVQTAGFSESPYVTAVFGMDTGFETFREYFPHRVLEERPRDFDRMDSERTIDDVVTWLDEHKQERFFVYVHLLPPHAPYNAPPPFADRFDPDYEGSVHGDIDTLLKVDKRQIRITARDLAHLQAQYQENLAYADHQVGRILDALRERDLFDRSLVIVSSDHGEAFLEHGRMMHNWTVYEEMIHVPLVIRFPAGLGEMPKTWDGVVELTDLMPTIFETMGVPVPDGAVGGSLLRELRGSDQAAGLARSWTAMIGLHKGALVLREDKLVLDTRSGKAELYNLRDDPSERNDLAKSKRQLVEQLVALLESGASKATSVREVELDEATKRSLRSLGYVE